MTKHNLMSPGQVNAVAQPLDPVDAALLHLNSVLADPDKRNRHRAHRAVGSFLMVRCEVRLEREQARRLLTACYEAGWRSAQVVVAHGAVSVLLDNENERSWTSTYERQVITPIIPEATLS